MGKFKNGEWQEIDHLELDPNETPTQHQNRKDYLEGEWSLAMGQGWMWKWE